MNSASMSVFAYGIVFPVSDIGGSREGDERKSYNGLKSIFSGGIAGASQICVTYPIEYVKTQIQLDEKGHNKLYDSTWDCVRKTFRQRGFVGFYRGLSVSLSGCIPKAAVRFYILESLRNVLGDATGQLTPGMKLFSGLCAGTAEAIVAVTPFETIKVKFINDERNPQPQYRGLVHGIRTIIKNEGIHGVYLGLTATVLKEGTNQAMRFFIVDSLKELYTEGDRNKSVPVFWTGAFGALAGAISVCGNNPIDVIKTRMQGLEASRYKSTLDCATKIWQLEGPRAFYKGVFPRMCRVSLDVAITFVAYDKLMELLHKAF